MSEEKAELISVGDIEREIEAEINSAPKYPIDLQELTSLEQVNHQNEPQEILKTVFQGYWCWVAES